MCSLGIQNINSSWRMYIFFLCVHWVGVVKQWAILVKRLCLVIFFNIYNLSICIMFNSSFHSYVWNVCFQAGPSLQLLPLPCLRVPFRCRDLHGAQHRMLHPAALPLGTHRACDRRHPCLPRWDNTHFTCTLQCQLHIRFFHGSYFGVFFLILGTTRLPPLHDHCGRKKIQIKKET